MEDGELYHCGSVGSGLNDSTRDEWHTMLSAIELPHSPFAGPVPPAMGRTFRWCDPIHVVEVAFGEWTTDGNLRHPVYLGRRSDKQPDDVVRET
jgi:ATP-dependent DNA ligase